MKVLILGGSGMLGHKLWQTCKGRYETFVTLRRPFVDYQHFEIFDSARTIDNVAAEDYQSVANAIQEVKPDAVVNCIGIVKQDPAATDPLQSIAVNALFPHQLARTCRDSSARLIHLSTDCVFSGARGNYNEDDKADADDLYGRSKLLGEVSGPNNLTLRTSMIGRELSGRQGLLEWFLGESGKRVRGFKHAIFSGLTTPTLSKLIADVISNHQDLHGVFHVAAEPISKFDLLALVKQTYGLDTVLDADTVFVCDRSLDGSRFKSATGFVAPTWPQMISELHSDPTRYETTSSSTTG